MTLTEKIRLVNGAPSLSKGAKLLTIEIIIASNFRGYCWHSVAALGEMISASESQVHRYIKEAHEGGWIEVKRRPCKTSIYSLGEKFGTQEPRVLQTTPKIKIKKNITVPDGISSSSPEKPYPLPLVYDILKLTGDKKSVGYWVRVVKKVPEAEIREGLSYLKLAIGESIVARPGAYLNALLLKNHPELRRSTTPAPTTVNKARCKIEPEVINPATQEESLAAIARIKAMLARKVS